MTGKKKNDDGEEMTGTEEKVVAVDLLPYLPAGGRRADTSGRLKLIIIQQSFLAASLARSGWS